MEQNQGGGTQVRPTPTPTPRPAAQATLRPTPPPVVPTVRLHWNPSREKGVSATGGGYLVCYSRQAGFDFSISPCFKVPYKFGFNAPTSTDIVLDRGHVYYFRILAYALAPDTLTEVRSAPSEEIHLTVP